MLVIIIIKKKKPFGSGSNEISLVCCNCKGACIHIHTNVFVQYSRATKPCNACISSELSQNKVQESYENKSVVLAERQGIGVIREKKVFVVLAERQSKQQ